jgi:alpha-2-macroglobulin
MSGTWGGRWLKGAAALGGLLVALAVTADGPAPSAARIEHISPTGRVDAVSQIEARFSAPMVAFGDPRGPEPFVIECPAPGAAHWVDSATWVYTFAQPVPAGVACRLRVKDGLRTLAGQPVGGEREFAFDTGGPRILMRRYGELGDTLERFLPGRGGIDERQIFPLTLATAADADSIRAEARCRVPGEPVPRRVELLTGQRQTDLLARLGRADEPNLVLVQCVGVLPADTRITLSWGAGIRTPGGLTLGEAQTLEFHVHPLFRLRTRCEDPKEPVECCNPERRIGVHFSVPVAAGAAAGLRLRGPGSVRTPVRFKAWESEVDDLWFAGPFAEQTTLRLEVPSGLTDATGRPLVAPEPAALTVTTGPVPRSPAVRFPAGDILESRVGAVLPVLVRDFNGPLCARWLRLGPTAGTPPAPGLDDRTLSDWLRRLAAPAAAKAGARPSPFPADAPTEDLSIEVPGRRGQLTTAGIPLPGPGVYAVEAQAPWLVATNPYPATLALVTNLAVNVKTAAEGPWLVWVTTLDEARPVADAAVRLTDACTGTGLGEGQTDPDGIARIDPRRPSDAAAGRCPLNGRILVSARAGDDLSFTLLTKEQLRDDRSAPPPILHTVYDRTLLRAGDTLSMKHILRRPSMDGFAVPAHPPATLRIEHSGSGCAYDLPLVWDARGISESTWAIPGDAPLGDYSVRLGDPPIASDGVELAEFRTPTMTARIEVPGGPLVSGDTPALDLAVDYLSGAPAADWPVSLSTRLEDEWETTSVPVGAPYEEFDFSLYYKPFGEVDPAAEVCRPDPGRETATPLGVTLNAAGQARVSLPPLPRVCEPRDLLTMLDYLDPNGQRLTATRRLRLWPAAVRPGLKVEPRAPGDPLRVAVVALDPAGQPAAGQMVTLDLLRRESRREQETLGNGLYRDRSQTRITPVATLCTGRTDRQGLLRCETRLPPTAIGDGLIVRAVARDARERIAVAARELNQAVWPWPRLDLKAVRDSAQTPDDLAVVERLERMAAKVPELFDGQGRDQLLEPDGGQTDYAPGETARLAVRLPWPNATALVTVEREGIMRAFVTPLAGERPSVVIPIEPRYAPNVRVSVLAVRGRQAAAAPPTGVTDPGKPDYVRGTVELRVDPSPYRLEVQVRPAGEVYPVRARVPVHIQVRRADGGTLPRDAEVAVAAVDEALLELQPNRSWAGSVLNLCIGL